MIYTYNYDTAYPGPALPVVTLQIAHADTPERWVSLQALVDSGADATLIPIRDLRRLGAKAVDKRRLVNASGVSYQVDVYVVALQVGPFTHPAVEVLANRQSNDTLLGRDVLNHLIVTLNGLAHMVEISD